MARHLEAVTTLTATGAARPASAALGQYLRARRELVRPGDVGLPDAGRRRVPGLRREELAHLAGISIDYYVRLEQGQDHRPSPEVLEALARALQLDAAATAHLQTLVWRTAPAPPAEPEPVSPSVRRLIDSWPLTAAIVHDRHMDVLASNALARTISPIFRPGTNLVASAFLDGDVRHLYRDWDVAVASAVACLRSLTVGAGDDPRLTALVGELSIKSEHFSRLWARHDVHRGAGARRHLDHPIAGPIELDLEKLAIAGTQGQTLIAYHARPGTRSAVALDRLASRSTAPTTRSSSNERTAAD
jgi:transcriptional regulator with XRE-family HTH domain